MEQKVNWMHYSRHMNKIALIFLLILSNCDNSTIEDIEWDVNIKLNFINESNYTIFTKSAAIDESLECNIPNLEPNDTYIYSFIQPHFGNSSNDKPSLENITSLKISCAFFYDNTLKCSRGVGDARNYTNGIQNSELNFEYTYVFTNEDFQESTDCN